MPPTLPRPSAALWNASMGCLARHARGPVDDSTGPHGHVQSPNPPTRRGPAPSDSRLGGLMGVFATQRESTARLCTPVRGTPGEQTELDNSRSPRPARIPRLERSGLLSEWLHREPVKADADGSTRTYRSAAHPRPEPSRAGVCATSDRPTADRPSTSPVAGGSSGGGSSALTPSRRPRKARKDRGQGAAGAPLRPPEASGDVL